MDEFFATIWHMIERLVWSDWITIAILATFLVLGFKRGMARELINLGFLLLAILIAWLFYQILAISSLITWLVLSHQSHLAISFGVIFIGVMIIKRIIYKLTQLSSTVDNPCVLNKLFALMVVLVAITMFSWHYLEVVAGLGIIEILIGNESVRIGLSFSIVFGFAFGILTFISSVLTISIDETKPCFLSSFFKKILETLQTIDTKLNAKNINSTQNNLLGLIVGLIKGNLAILIMVLVLQSISWVSQKYYWIETHGALKAFQDVASDIKPELSQYLLFIENN
ncbi:CvpA family protein [Candidatus Ruthia endofausta]|uniref:CvpA family protein n=1 Tax=Candidatus Ruthia endofausta TaxID=2738852 RepID=A0A6N0HQ70_9GAMM|nr:CvpA family protein [Candidatus Ruthia endofausta]QKQ24493.1 CvpA family protein [Candidatus Ruthia endofausta]